MWIRSWMNLKSWVISLELSENLIRTVYENEAEREDHVLIEEILNLTQSITDYNKYLSASKTEFKFRHHVGFIQTDNYRIQVLPKIWKSNFQGEIYSVKNLIKLLLYAFAPPRFNVPQTDILLEKSDFDLFDLLIRLYATSLVDQLSIGAYRRYIRNQEESKYLKGKLNIRKQINKIDQSKFDIDYFSFSSDNNLNRFFVYATKTFRDLTRDIQNLEILSYIESILGSEKITFINSNVRINFNRLNQRFEIPYTYAKIILDNLLILSGNSRKAMMMLFDMNVVFERFVAKFIERNQGTIFAGMEVKELSPQSSKRNFIYNKNGRPLRITRPDLKVTAANSTYIFDTKYKILNVPDIDENDNDNADEIGRISPCDLYQMFTYSELYKSSATVLVFPGAKNCISDPYQFRNNGGVLWVYMLHLDLNIEDWEDKLASEFRAHFVKIQTQAE